MFLLHAETGKRCGTGVLRLMQFMETTVPAAIWPHTGSGRLSATASTGFSNTKMIPACIERVAFYLLSAAEDISDEELAVHSLSALSRLYIEVGRYDSAYIYVVQALELSKKKHSVTHFVDIYNNLGKINFFCEYYDKAAEYWETAISFPETHGTPYSKVLVINNSLKFGLNFMETVMYPFLVVNILNL